MYASVTFLQKNRKQTNHHSSISQAKGPYYAPLHSHNQHASSTIFKRTICCIGVSRTDDERSTLSCKKDLYETLTLLSTLLSTGPVTTCRFTIFPMQPGDV